MMNRLIIIAATVLALTGCTQKRFDRVENTPVSRYDIVYDDTKCGVDYIAVCTIDFSVHSAGELSAAIKSISAIEGVDEVHRVEID